MANRQLKDSVFRKWCNNRKERNVFLERTEARQSSARAQAF